MLICIANILQPRIALDITTPPTMLITAILLGANHEIVDMAEQEGLRGLGTEALGRVLNLVRFRIREGRLEVLRERKVQPGDSGTTSAAGVHSSQVVDSDRNVALLVP